MFINSFKSKCIRFGPRCKNTCANITTRDSKIIEWFGSCMYPSLFFISGRKLKTSNDNAKAKCLPILLYGTEAYYFSVRETTSMEYPISCALIKVFNTKSSDILENCKLAFGFRPFALSVAIGKRHFYNKYATTDNALCQPITAFTLSSDYVVTKR